MPPSYTNRLQPSQCFLEFVGWADECLRRPTPSRTIPKIRCKSARIPGFWKECACGWRIPNWTDVAASGCLWRNPNHFEIHTVGEAGRMTRARSHHPTSPCPRFMRVVRPGGVRAVVAESVLAKHQLLILNRVWSKKSCIWLDA